MCDDTTEAENERHLQRLRLSRREWGVGAGAMVATALSGCGPSKAPSSAPAAGAKDDGKAETPDTEASTEPRGATSGETAASTKHRKVTVKTPDGEAEGYFVAPEAGEHPAVLIWPDVAGLRPAFEQMAARLAAQGYAVLAVNHYYRSSTLPILETFAEWQTEEGKAKIAPMREAMTPEGISSDAAAFVAWLDEQPEVDASKKVGTTGYCMGGPYTIRTAAAAPDRVGALGSFHGGGLVTEADDSPHRLFAKMKAAALICIAQNDDERQPEAKRTLEQAATGAGVDAEIEVYPAQHGWCVTDSPVYDEAQAERAWSRLLATFERIS